MTDTTLEEAGRCPKCGKPGQEGKVRLARNMKPGTKHIEFWCRTPLCPWEDTPWMVQVNPDGSVPPPTNHTGQPKVYEGFEGHDEAAKQIIDGLKRQFEAEQLGDAEVRRPRG